MQSIPVYSFIGYHTEKIDYVNEIGFHPNSVTIIVHESEFDVEKNFYSLRVTVQLKYNVQDKKSTFTFLSKFKINDIKWMESLNTNILDGILFSTVFPYIRSKISPDKIKKN